MLDPLLEDHPRTMARNFDPDKAQTTLFSAFLDAMAEHGSDKPIVEDVERQPLTYGRLALASLILGDKLAQGTRSGETVGLLLPNVNGLVATILGLNAFGRVAAMLNFTAGVRNLRSALQTGIIRTVVTSRRFVDTAKLEDVVQGLADTETLPGRKVRIVYLEDVRKSISLLDKIKGVMRARVARRFHRARALGADQAAVVLFTSGTEGSPKGVVLTSANLVANARQIYAHADGMLSPADIVLNPLPMFHSFGLTAGTLMPILNGVRTVLYPSPLHYKQIPALIRATKSTFLFATDTFLQGYARAAEPGDLDSVRVVVAGAERVKDATRQLWARTGAIIVEGYGATECSPVLSCNLPASNTPGTVGLLLPGIEARLEPVEGIAEGGRLLVRGPNVMAGYLLHDKPGIIVPPRGGWHDTGDIVSIENGLITIRGRAKRFAKIGGEMISLAAVETLVSSLWPDSNHVVISLPDPKKGEQLVLVTDRANADKDALIAHAKKEGFAELWVPKAILVVGAIPVLGSGKVDLPATQDMVKRTRALL